MNKAVIAAIGVGIAVAILLAISLQGNEVENVGDSIQTSPMPQEQPTMQGDEGENVGDSGKIRIVASFYPYYEFAKNVAGDAATVEQFLPVGVEAHDWEPRARQIQSLGDADVIVYNGLGVDSYVENLIESGEFEHVLFVAASYGVPLISVGDKDEHGDDEHGDDEHGDDEHGDDEHGDDEHGDDEHGDDEHGDDEHGDGHGGHTHDEYEFDPHIWLDPVLVKQQVYNIRDGLAEIDPENAAVYEDNAQKYAKQLDDLNARIISSLESCETDTLVTFHNAFSYFNQRYGLEGVSLGGLSPDSEASAADIKWLVDFVSDNDVRVIFSEDVVDPRLAQTIADETGAQLMLFSPLEAVTQEELQQGVTYISKMESNMEALKVALRCT